MPLSIESIPLVAFFKLHPSGAGFPDQNADYYDRFLKMHTYLNGHVHPTVNQGATANGDGWLTDHGPLHIETVIRRASDLAMKSATETFLTPYEVFLLLVACHLHDVGNVFGRNEHEHRIQDAIRSIESELGRITLGSDAMEIRMLINIAMAHGGYADAAHTDKDTINLLRAQWPNANEKPRVTLLAAILRFADELADDYSRTNRFLQNSGVIAQGSEIYHVYADRLREVSVRATENHIHVRFEIAAADVCRKFAKGGQQVYLFDEIAARALKMHHEHVYCSRFFAGNLHIDSITITINISRTFGANRLISPLHKISFTMRQVGYPDNSRSLSELDPLVAGIDGESLRQTVLQLEGN